MEKVLLLDQETPPTLRGTPPTTHPTTHTHMLNKGPGHLCYRSSMLDHSCHQKKGSELLNISGSFSLLVWVRVSPVLKESRTKEPRTCSDVMFKEKKAKREFFFFK